MLFVFGDPNLTPTNTAANCSHFEKDGVEKHENLNMKISIFIDIYGFDRNCWWLLISGIDYLWLALGSAGAQNSMSLEVLNRIAN